MFNFLNSLSGNSPEPFPSSTSFDETKVNPGAIGGLVFLGSNNRGRFFTI